MESEIIKRRINEKIRKWQILLEVADDPEMIEFLKGVLGNGNGNGNSIQPIPQPDAVPTGIPSHSVASANGNDNLVLLSDLLTRDSRGGQQRAVEAALRQATEPVTTKWIVRRMEQSGYTFLASRPQVAVNECLAQAKKQGRADFTRKHGIENYWMAIQEPKKAEPQ